MATTKIYAPLSAKVHIFQNGGEVLKISGNVEKLVAWLTANQNKRGYINLVVSSRKEVGKYGDTHTVCLDTWEPPSQRDDPPPEQPPEQPAKHEDDGLPF